MLNSGVRDLDFRAEIQSAIRQAFSSSDFHGINNITVIREALTPQQKNELAMASKTSPVLLLESNYVLEGKINSTFILRTEVSLMALSATIESTTIASTHVLMSSRQKLLHPVRTEP